MENYKEIMNEADGYYKFLQKEGYTKDEALWIVYKNIGKIKESVNKN